MFLFPAICPFFHCDVITAYVEDGMRRLYKIRLLPLLRSNLKSVLRRQQNQIFWVKMVKAWFYNEYGSVDVLQFGEIQVPSPERGMVLIKVRAAGLNPKDYKIRQYGMRRSENAPFPVVPGCDVAGVVAAVGESVSRLKKGDEVYGDIQDGTVENRKQLGALAEYTLAEEHVLALKPSNLSFEEAASLPLALLTALQAFETVGFEKGQSVFIVGGAGGVGSLAIQLAKNVFEASRIVSTSSAAKAEFVQSLGADVVVDYTKQSYEKVDEKFDFVFDTIGESFKSHVVAKEGGKIVDIATFPAHPRAVNVIVKPRGSDLERLGKFIESGKVKAVIDPKSPYSFSGVVEAFKYLESGRVRGKTVISPIE